MGKISVVGTGPGARAFLTRAAEEAIKNADVLVGGRSALSCADYAKRKKVICANMAKVVEFIKKNRRKDIAVLTSGDPGFYSILELILKNFPSKGVEIVPGISSMQLAFARIKDTWQDARFISLHGRNLRELANAAGCRKIAVLTDRNNTPDRVARFLLSIGADGKAFVCDNLTRQSEKLVEGSIADISTQKFSGNCVMVLYLRTAPEKWGFRTPGIPDARFVRKNTPMTKEEVRVITLSKARIKEDSIIYDIGAGSGSISVEAGILARNGRVFSIEKNAERARVIKKNAASFCLGNVEIVRGEAPEALENLPAADRIIIGGSGGRLREILQEHGAKLNDDGIIVINAVTRGTLAEAVSVLKDLNFGFSVTQVSICRHNGKALQVLNPVFVIAAQRGENDA